MRDYSTSFANSDQIRLSYWHFNPEPEWGPTGKHDSKIQVSKLQKDQFHWMFTGGAAAGNGNHYNTPAFVLKTLKDPSEL